MTDKEARSRVRELVAKAESGETTAVVEIRQLLADHPEIFRRLGDVASCAHKAWINVIAGKNVELREMLIHRVGDLKRQLRRESTDTAIACLVIDQVVGTWLQLYYAEMRDAIDSPQSLKWAAFQLKRLESAHRRHMKTSVLWRRCSVSCCRPVEMPSGSLARSQTTTAWFQVWR